jgi:hypothetical protein
MPESDIELTFQGETHTLNGQYVQKPNCVYGVARFNREYLHHAMEQVAAQIGYTLVGVINRPQVCAFPVEVVNESNGWQLKGWLVYPLNPRILHPSLVTHVAIYARDEDIMVSGEGRKVYQRIWAAELMAKEVTEKLAQVHQHDCDAGEPSALEAPELKADWLANIAQGYLQTYGVKYNLHISQLVLPWLDETMMVYTLPDGSSLATMPSGVIWEGRMSLR